MNGVIVKRTQSSLGKVIKKPLLTEKLLSKPPFRYLHDIFSEVIRTTGFMKGLYKDNELRSECIKDKEMKMAFLQKAIDVVALVTGEPLAVKPAHIVAGHEPEKTNELLQVVAKCCLSKVCPDVQQGRSEESSCRRKVRHDSQRHHIQGESGEMRTSPGKRDAAQKPLSKEGGDTVASSFSSEMASSDKQTARPSSARPAPPRVKTQESFTDGVPSERLSSAKSSVIIDGKKLSDDDDNEDEQFLVAEAAPEPADAPERPFESAHDLNVEEKHGGLVKKILETKKDYELSSIKSKEKMVSEEAWKKEQDLVMREIERLRASIQSVCQSALPLGKLMDYVQEDIDAMQAELQSWRKENKEHAQALLQEQRATDQAVEPLKTELGELDQMIKDYQDKICTMRCNILMNEEKIQKKLAAIISSKT
ncbi:TRAF3-interacting protein 1-like isoform X3 [Dunckerocampus dactyliophorus]|uniref:TRAF3-interacting protein 1-like isoform X3 n=1 Tax=Dunckerocampus dactyliophorus TaxID=161453 RepID=UPI002406CE2C|nr:TRAF3-interacting protein 1-like isoform X3 [Dunckerocampus dactyliophorus]